MAAGVRAESKGAATTGSGAEVAAVMEPADNARAQGAVAESEVIAPGSAQPSSPAPGTAPESRATPESTGQSPLAAGAARESAPVAAAAPTAAELVELVANKSARETERLLAELEPEVALPRERERALGGGRYEVRVILDQHSVETIANLKGWLSHVNPGFTTGQLLAYLLQQAERKYDPGRERGRTRRRSTASAASGSDDAPVPAAAGGPVGAAPTRQDAELSHPPGPDRVQHAHRSHGSPQDLDAQPPGGGDRDPRPPVASGSPQPHGAPQPHGSVADQQPPRTARSPQNLAAPLGAGDSPGAEIHPRLAAAMGLRAERRKRGHVSAAVRREVLRHYGAACCYRDPDSGVVCGSTHLLQIDHIVPLTQGGSDQITNLRPYCAIHNRMRDPRCARYGSKLTPSSGARHDAANPTTRGVNP